MDRETIEKAIEMLQQMLDMESKLDKKQNELVQLNEEIKQLENEKTSCENALASVFDGLKYVANPDKPFDIVLPMKVYTNQYYNYNDVRYVCIKECVFDGTNIDECLTEF